MALDMTNEADSKMRFIHAAHYTTTAGELYVVTKCPLCGQYLELGFVHEVQSGVFEFSEWRCQTHGDIKPVHDLRNSE